jgi:hypothetical protein
MGGKCMKKIFFLVILFISTITLSFLFDPLNYITKSNLGLQLQFYNKGGKISIYNPFVYKIVSFDNFTETMRFPEIVKGLAYIESGFNIHALSNVGAMGVAQFKADAAIDYGVFNAWNPQQALLGADRMIRYYYQKYNDIYKVLAIYNIGETNYKKGKYIEQGNAYANKVISASRTVSRKSYLYDRYVLYLQGTLTENSSQTYTAFSFGGIFDYLGIVYFDISSTFHFREGYFPIELGTKSYIRINHFASFVIGYNLGYNLNYENEISIGPIIGYSHFRPIGESYEIYYDFSKGFSLNNFFISIGYGNKYWRINFGFEPEFNNLFINITI